MGADSEPSDKYEGQRRELARLLDCLTDQDLQTLAGVLPSTTEAWRKRGTGPAYTRLGTTFLYPRKAVAQYIETLVRERPEAPAKGML